MNQQEHSSQLSALFDNELSPEQAELVIRRALKDPAMRTSWGRYALIGACMRGEPLAGRSRPENDVAARVRIKLAVEGDRAAGQGEVSAAAPSRARERAMLWRGAMGMAIAASVAAVSLLLVRTEARIRWHGRNVDARAGAVPAGTSHGNRACSCAGSLVRWSRNASRAAQLHHAGGQFARRTASGCAAGQLRGLRTAKFPRRRCASARCRR